MSDLRWRRGESRKRLLDAALAAVAKNGPDGVSGRTIAQAADAHHAQIQQMFGTVDALIQQSLLRERDRFLAENFAGPGPLPDPFVLVDYPSFWKAVVQVVLDPGSVNLAELAADGPVERASAVLNETVKDDSQRRARAGAWVAIPIGHTIFGSTFQTGLGLSDTQMLAGTERIKHRLSQLVTPELAIPDHPRSAACKARPAQPQPEAADAKLVAAAQHLLAGRLETGITGRQLANHAGVNSGLISHYFGSKAAVFDRALVELHQSLVAEALDGTQSGGPEIFTRHRTFIRAWASRLVGDRPVPDFELVGMRSMIDATRSQRPSSIATDALGDAMAAMSLGLGWAVMGTLPAAAEPASSTATTEQIYRIHHWLLSEED